MVDYKMVALASEFKRQNEEPDSCMDLRLFDLLGIGRDKTEGGMYRGVKYDSNLIFSPYPEIAEALTSAFSDTRPYSRTYGPNDDAVSVRYIDPGRKEPSYGTVVPSDRSEQDIKKYQQLEEGVQALPLNEIIINDDRSAIDVDFIDCDPRLFMEEGHELGLSENRNPYFVRIDLGEQEPTDGMVSCGLGDSLAKAQFSSHRELVIARMPKGHSAEGQVCVGVRQIVSRGECNVSLIGKPLLTDDISAVRSFVQTTISEYNAERKPEIVFAPDALPALHPKAPAGLA
jgi:hypothetical protein